MKCDKCGGSGIITYANGTYEVCNHCEGSGQEPYPDRFNAVDFFEVMEKVKSPVPGKKKKTRFEVITESPTSLADFLMDVRCNVGHYKYDEYPPASEPEEMERWLNEECEW